MSARFVVAIILCGGTASAADYPRPVEVDAVIKAFRFAIGKSLDLQLHYSTVGEPRHDKRGKVVNAVLILHGTTGSSAQNAMLENRW